MTASTLPDAALPKPPSMNRLIVAATIGNVFEWFDFVVYGFFAVTLAQVFFPAGDPTVSLLVTFGAFGLAYVVRPLGAIVVGGYTDRAGRKAGLLLSMALMMIGTTLMAVTPGYATIGIAAPIILTLARLLQGFSVGGEFGSAVSFLAEHGGGRRGFAASWQFATGGMITVLASLFGVSLTTLLSHEQLVDWGWRIPYFFGMLVGPAGLYIRAKGVETPEFVEGIKTPKCRVMLSLPANAMSHPSRPWPCQIQRKSRFSPRSARFSSKITPQINGLNLKFATRAEQWNFFAEQRIFLALTME